MDCMETRHRQCFYRVCYEVIQMQPYESGIMDPTWIARERYYCGPVLRFFEDYICRYVFYC